MGDPANYYHRVKPDLPIDINRINEWRDRLDEMQTWCYINYGDEWGYDTYGFWFKTQVHANWFTLRWLNDRVD